MFPLSENSDKYFAIRIETPQKGAATKKEKAVIYNALKNELKNLLKSRSFLPDIKVTMKHNNISSKNNIVIFIITFFPT